MPAYRRRVALCVALGLIVAGCGSVAAPPTPAASPPAPVSTQPSPSSSTQPASQSLTPVTVETSFLPSSSQLPLYLALDRGYFRAHGLNVKVISGKGSVLTVQQIASGQYDLGLADLTSMAELRAKGVPVEAFMAETDKTTFGLTVSKSITTWSDLYGKSVLIAPGNAAVFLLPATFDKLGLDIHKVRVDNVPAGSLDTDYMAGKADGAAGDVAGAFPRENAARPSNKLWFADELDVVGYGFFSRRAYIAANPTVIRDFVAGAAEAIRALGAGGVPVADEAAKDMIAANPNPSYTVQGFAPAWPLYQQFIRSYPGHGTGWEDPAAWATTLQVLEKYAGLRGVTTPSDYFTNAYIGPAAS